VPETPRRGKEKNGIPRRRRDSDSFWRIKMKIHLQEGGG
jgi:hypothetical protein